MAPHADENTALLNSASSQASAANQGAQTQQPKKRSLWRRLLNPTLGRTAWWLFEFCDLWIIPPFIRRRCQAMLTAAWTHRTPLLQKASPAELAANLIKSTLDDLDDTENSKISVVDFCSGAGGPTPAIESIVNTQRHSNSLPAIPFLLTDLHPHIDSWLTVCSRSDNLSFIPQPVDATDPPAAVISASSSPNPNSNSSSANPQATEFSSATRIFRLYCLSFHHFPDGVAEKVLRSSMGTADGFAIIELQRRDLASVALILGHVMHMFLTSWLWFWKDPLMLLMTYVLPIVPAVVTFDGVVSCLRTRGFEEVVALVDDQDRAEGGSGKKGIEIVVEIDKKGREIKVVRKDGWVFKGGCELHTWPVGYMNWVVGVKEKRIEAQVGI